ncbi:MULTISPECIES: hypothetical protein [unclassified Salinisphaera]|uniref:hypothetical protein n=1 Tax=unclassified Salinisphaera TaxID=2649847 RepID=UPI003341B5BE
MRFKANRPDFDGKSLNQARPHRRSMTALCFRITGALGGVGRSVADPHEHPGTPGGRKDERKIVSVQLFEK